MMDDEIQRIIGKMRSMTEEERKIHQDGINSLFKPTGRNLHFENYYMSVWPKPVEILCPVCGMEFTDEKKFERHLERCYKIQEKIRKQVRKENAMIVSMWENRRNKHAKD